MTTMSDVCKGTGAQHRWDSREAGRGGTSVFCSSCFTVVNTLSTVRERDALRNRVADLEADIVRLREALTIAACEWSPDTFDRECVEGRRCIVHERLTR